MVVQPRPALKLETEWLREYARTYLPCEAAFSFSPATLRAAGINLVDIRNAFRTGVVIFADKLDDPGAVWIVEGEDGDGGMLSIVLVVTSEIWSVRLREVRRIYEQEVNGNDAA